MTAEEFLKLADQLDKRINAKLKEIDGIRKLLYGVSATSMEESYNATKNTTAPYVRNIEKIMLMENEINEEIDKLVDLKIAVSKAIDALPNATFSLILRYRYIENMTWSEISKTFKVEEKTIRRWHNTALETLIVPEEYLSMN